MLANFAHEKTAWTETIFEALELQTAIKHVMHFYLQVHRLQTLWLFSPLPSVQVGLPGLPSWLGGQPPTARPQQGMFSHLHAWRRFNAWASKGQSVRATEDAAIHMGFSNPCQAVRIRTSCKRRTAWHRYYGSGVDFHGIPWRTHKLDSATCS